MKKLLTALMIAVFLVVPVHGAAPSAVPAAGQAETMAPVIHGALLAMSHLGADRFDPADEALAWEALYNTMSLCSQLDEDAVCDGSGFLLLSAEDAAGFAALLPGGLPAGELPGGLADRMTPAPGGGYRLVCGSDDLAEVEFSSSQWSGEELLVEGALVSAPDGGRLLSFRAVLQPQDSGSGLCLAELVLL